MTAHHHVLFVKMLAEWLTTILPRSQCSHRLPGLSRDGEPSSSFLSPLGAVHLAPPDYCQLPRILHKLDSSNI
jgi:hypothetical protein